MLPALFARNQAANLLAASCSSILRSCCCNRFLAVSQQQQQQQQQQQLPQQHWQQQLQHHAGFAAAAPSILSKASVFTPSRQSQLVVQYPRSDPVEYYSPRRVMLYNIEKQQLAAVELPGDIFNVPGESY
jgi:hypothetical protein